MDGVCCGVMALAALLLLAQERWRSRVVRALEAEIEALQDRAWQVAEAEECARRQVEARTRAEAASEAKSRFLANVSHEVRTPLNGILGMADLALDTAPTPEQATYLGAIKASGEALLSLVDEILDFSRIEAGRIDLAHEPFDLAGLVEGVVELLGPRAQGKGLEIAALIRSGVPASVVGDADRLRQVLVNLAGNAVKFTQAGGVGLTVEGQADGRLAFIVADTGPGLDPARIGQLFEEFEQGDDSVSRRHGGTGLGLAITRRIVAHMGGEVSAENRAGGGALFRVVLPLAPAEAAGAAEPVPDLRGRRILVVARSPFEAPALAARLGEAGAECRLAADPVEALAILDAVRPDLLVADRALGDEAVRALARAARARGVARNLVLLSPFDRRGFGSPRAAGFDGYLVKPVRARSLFERLRPPAVEEGSASELRRAPPGVEPARPGAGRRVLLAEDNDINALLAARSLEKLGATVDRAQDGHQALALARAALLGERPAYDLVLMDVRMPDLDGLAATRSIRALEAARPGPRLRIVALTADRLREDEAARAAGLDEVLAKPFALGDLARLLAAAGASERDPGSPRSEGVEAGLRHTNVGAL